MTSTEEYCFNGRGTAALKRSSGQAILTVLAWPFRAWRNRPDLEAIMDMSPEQLRDIGLTG